MKLKIKLKLKIENEMCLPNRGIFINDKKLFQKLLLVPIVNRN